LGGGGGGWGGGGGGGNEMWMNYKRTLILKRLNPPIIFFKPKAPLGGARGEQKFRPQNCFCGSFLTSICTIQNVNMTAFGDVESANKRLKSLETNTEVHLKNLGNSLWPITLKK